MLRPTQAFLEVPVFFLYSFHGTLARHATSCVGRVTKVGGHGLQPAAVEHIVRAIFVVFPFPLYFACCDLFDRANVWVFVCVCVFVLRQVIESIVQT